MPKRERYDPMEAFRKQEKRRRKEAKAAKKVHTAKEAAKHSAKEAPKHPAKELKSVNPDDYYPAINPQQQQQQSKLSLRAIPIPKGIAPETDGQIYHALDLPIIRDPSKVEGSSTQTVIVTAPQKMDLTNLLALVPAALTRKKME
jgi:sRNA-binding protein